MTVVDTRTGEVMGFDRAAAERRAERITLRLDALADNVRAVLPMIREAIEKRDDIALGYRSPGDYVSDRFGQSLSGLGMEIRRAVVGELTAAGLSIRSIAPVVGVSKDTVQRDQVSHVRHLVQTPESPSVKEQGPVTVSRDADDVDVVVTDTHDGDLGSDTTTDVEDGGSTERRSAEASVVVHPEGGEATSASLDPAQVEAAPDVSAPRPPVVGIDGKTYTRPAAVLPAKTEESKAPRRRPLPESVRDTGWELRKVIERAQRLVEDDRFAANKEQVAPRLRNDLNFAIKVCQDLLDRINNN